MTADSPPKHTIESLAPAIRHAGRALVADVLFIIAPIIVVTMVLLITCHSISEVISSPEWSLASAVLFGLTISKFVAGISRTRPGSWEVPLLVVTKVMVLGLIPSLVLLTLLLVNRTPCLWLGICQILLFLLAIAVFFKVGATSHLALHYFPDHPTPEPGDREQE